MKAILALVVMTVWICPLVLDPAQLMDMLIVLGAVLANFHP